MSRLRNHLKKLKKTEVNPFTILQNLAIWIGHQEVQFNPVDMKITLGNETLAVVYDSLQPNDMSDIFWEHAHGKRYLVRVNIFTLGFDFDDEDEFIATDTPDEISGAVIGQAWIKLINTIWVEDDGDLLDAWGLPFTITIHRGNISMAGVKIGHWWNDGRVRLVDFASNTENYIFIENATIPDCLTHFVKLFYPFAT